jgi:hypothetical protein
MIFEEGKHKVVEAETPFAPSFITLTSLSLYPDRL